MTPHNLYTDMVSYRDADDLEAYYISKGDIDKADDLVRKQAVVALRIAAALVRLHSLSVDEIVKGSKDE